jgi:hypothetical protein
MRDLQEFRTVQSVHVFAAIGHRKQEFKIYGPTVWAWYVEPNIFNLVCDSKKKNVLCVTAVCFLKDAAYIFVQPNACLYVRVRLYCKRWLFIRS